LIYLVAVNAAISLVCSVCLLLLWCQNRSQSFTRSMGLAQFCNAMAVLSYMLWRGPLPALALAGLAGIALASAGVFMFGTRAVFELGGRQHSRTVHWLAVLLLFMVYGGVLVTESGRLFGLLNLLIYCAIGLYAVRLLWSRGWAERSIGLAMVLLGLNFLNLALPGEAGLSRQLAIGTVLRVALVMAFAFAAMRRARQHADVQRKRFERLSEDSAQGIVVSDGVDILYTNRAARRVLGLELYFDARNPAPLKLAPFEFLSMEEVAALLGGSLPYSEARRGARRHDGIAIHVRLSSWITEWDGKTAIQLLLRDDTEQFRVEQQLAASQAEYERARVEFAERSKNALIQANAELEQRVAERTQALEQASLAKSQFLANMSHEIRTPMNVILGLLQLLRGTQMSPLQMDYSDKAESAAKSLLILLNDILDFSKIDAGKMELELTPFEPERLMRDLSVVLSIGAAGRPVEVLFDLDPGIPAVVVGDSARLLQVLINLSSNALKFTPTGEVIVQCVVQELGAGEVKLRFAVHDTGIGIAPHNHSRIFEVFSQAEASTTRRFGGSGLGLSICKRLLDLMGSTLLLESAEGEGSHFYFDLRLPLGRSVALEPAVPAAGPGLSVLVVDDNADALRLISTMAEGLGWVVDSCSSGGAALELTRQRLASGQGAHQVMLVDWEMQNLDGWQTLQGIAALCGEQPQPLAIMVSSHGRERLNQRSEQEIAALGAYLIKPVTATMLAEAVGRSLQGASNLRANPRAAAQRTLRLDGMHILLVEDNPLNQLVARELLHAEGAQVQCANNGREGVDAVRDSAKPFDVVLMDMQMPVMDGCSASRMLRDGLGLKELPIIAMTANTMQSDREHCLAAGMNDHVGKPFDINYLIEVLLRHTGRLGHQAQRSVPPSPPALTSAKAVFDRDAAVRDMGDDLGLYVQVLGSYLDELAQFAAQLQASLQADDRALAIRMVHTLKGTSATVGANAMSTQALLLERELRDPQAALQALQHLAPFLSELQRSLDLLRPVYASLRDSP